MSCSRLFAVLTSHQKECRFVIIASKGSSGSSCWIPTWIAKKVKMVGLEFTCIPWFQTFFTQSQKKLKDPMNPLLLWRKCSATTEGGQTYIFSSKTVVNWNSDVDHPPLMFNPSIPSPAEKSLRKFLQVTIAIWKKWLVPCGPYVWFVWHGWFGYSTDGDWLKGGWKATSGEWWKCWMFFGSCKPFVGLECGTGRQNELISKQRFQAKRLGPRRPYYWIRAYWSVIVWRAWGFR